MPFGSICTGVRRGALGAPHPQPLSREGRGEKGEQRRRRLNKMNAHARAAHDSARSRT